MGGSEHQLSFIIFIWSFLLGRRRRPPQIDVSYVFVHLPSSVTPATPATPAMPMTPADHGNATPAGHRNARLKVEKRDGGGNVKIITLYKV
jgi:hypothetical protein